MSIASSSVSIAWVSTGAAFDSHFAPPFLGRITQNQRVTIHGIKLHKTKHLRLGQGIADGGMNAHTYVFFPNLAVSGTTGITHLTDDQ